MHQRYLLRSDGHKPINIFVSIAWAHRANEYAGLHIHVLQRPFYLADGGNGAGVMAIKKERETHFILFTLGMWCNQNGFRLAHRVGVCFLIDLQYRWFAFSTSICFPLRTVFVNDHQQTPEAILSCVKCILRSYIDDSMYVMRWEAVERRSNGLADRVQQQSHTRVANRVIVRRSQMQFNSWLSWHHHHSLCINKY